MPSARSFGPATRPATQVLLVGAALFLGDGARGADPPRPSSWRIYRAADGLTESLTTAITLNPRGNLWVKHGEVDAVSFLDGYTIRHIPAPGERTYRVYESRAGKIWSAYPHGLLEFGNDEWLRKPLAELRARAEASPLRPAHPVPLLPAEQDRVLLLLPDRLAEYRSLSDELRVLRWARETRLDRFIDLLPANDGGVWVSGAKGLARLAGPLRQLGPQTPWREHLLPAELRVQDLQRPFEDDDGGLTTIGESAVSERRVLVHFNGTNWLTREVPGESLRYAWRDGEPGRFWGLTFNSLVRLEPGREGADRIALPPNQYFDVAVQPRGVFWLATLGGLMRYTPPAWRPPPGGDAPDAVVYAAVEDAQGRAWFATATGLLGSESRSWRLRAWPERFEASFHARDGLWALSDGRVVVSAAEQFWLFDPRTGGFEPVSPPENRRPRKVLFQWPDGTLCLQTAEPSGAADAYRFERYDGQAFSAWAEAPPAVDLGNELFFLAPASNGDVWLGGSAGPAVWREGKWQRFTAGDGYAAEGALCWTEFADGRIWCAGLGRILEFDGKTWTTVLSGLDRVNAMIRASDATVWVATTSGLFRQYKDAWAAVGVDEGLPADTCFSLLEDRARRLWVGTSRGMSQYHPRADIDPPRTSAVTVEPTIDVRSENTVQVTLRGRDRWQFTSDERLLFSHRLDGGSWSPFLSGPNAVLRGVTAGKHRLEVRALDRNWNLELKPVIADFQILLPWYRERRVLYVAFAGLAVTLFFAGLAVNRHLQLRRSYAEVEHKVAERTRALEQATQALVHSQKMTALGTLAAGIAHDFNNILSIIRGSAQIIETNLADSEKVLTRVARIKTMVDQASGIVRAMLGFGRVGESGLKPCDAGELVDETIRLLGDRFRRTTRVERTLEPDLPPVRGARDLMQQMLLNLILNAADALEREGEIRISARRLDTPPANPILAPQPAGQYVAIAVHDSGHGIPAEILPRIFEPFFTTKAFSSRRGTGLGLYMVYEFAREMGHGLLVSSEPGQGSTFTILAPAIEQRDLPRAP